MKLKKNFVLKIKGQILYVENEIELKNSVLKNK